MKILCYQNLECDIKYFYVSGTENDASFIASLHNIQNYSILKAKSKRTVQLFETLSGTKCGHFCSQDSNFGYPTL